MSSNYFVYVTSEVTPDLVTQDPVEALEMFLHACGNEDSAELKWSA